YQQFGQPGVWTVFADVLPAFDWLASRDIRLAVVSNWDERLHRILTGLKLRKYLDIVLVSREVGFNKPSPVIFEEALRKLGLPPESVLHVGDNRDEDLDGARAAGLPGLELVRTGRPTREDQIASLAELAGRLGP
ncbi:MAG: HAD-IA family hydrolase, partial [Opitutaceae bacterium]|nr:HAD-IA family hydrolase [Verrucomicrobiales bacterium]